MIYPIQMYGAPVLRKKTIDIEVGSIDLRIWSQDLFETMYTAHGVGLAAPQIGKSLRIFVVDGSPLQENDKMKALKKIFVNPRITARSDTLSEREEGCLSIPGVSEKILRSEKIKIKFFDIDWQLQEEEYTGIAARIIQHEYDHIEGTLFIDHLIPLKKRLLKKKLTQISKGDVDVHYRIASALHK